MKECLVSPHHISGLLGEVIAQTSAGFYEILDLPGISKMNPSEKEVLLSDDSDKKSIANGETNAQAEVTAEATSQPPSVPAQAQNVPVAAAQNGVVQRQRPDQFQSLFGPMLDELEQAVNSNMAELDKLEE